MSVVKLVFVGFAVTMALTALVAKVLVNSQRRGWSSPAPYFLSEMAVTQISSRWEKYD